MAASSHLDIYFSAACGMALDDIWRETFAADGAVHLVIRQALQQAEKLVRYLTEYTTSNRSQATTNLSPAIDDQFKLFSVT